MREYVRTNDHRAYLQDDSALNSAVCYNHPDILLILLEAGTDPNIHGEHVPALHVAAANDNLEAAMILISHGAKIDVRDTANNDTPLLYGIRDGKFRVAELLLEAGADPNLTDRRGFAPVHIAVLRNDAKLVQCLLDHGAAINVRTPSDGRTPLMIAAAAGFEEMVEILLSRGADPSIADSGGKSPFERAVECHRSGVAEILKKVTSPLTTFNPEGGQNLNFAMPAEWIGKVKPAAESSHTEWLKRAIALETTKDWQGLLDWCGKWTKSEPKNADAWYGLGNAYESLNHYDDAIEAYRQAIRIDPKNAEARYNLGVAYSLSGNRTAALGAVRELQRIDPTGADELYNLIVRL